MKTPTSTNRYRFALRLLVVVVVFSFGAVNATAIPFSEYHELVAHVVTDFRSLLEKNEDESDADFESRIAETLDAVRKEFPKSQEVESGNVKWTADNTWLHTAIDELQRVPVEKRTEKIGSIVELLRALDQRLYDVENAAAANDTKATDKQKLSGILTRPEYASDAKGPNALTKLIKDLIKWIEDLFPKPEGVEPGRATAVSSILQVVIVILGLALVVYVAWLLLKRLKAPGRRKLFTKKEPRIVLGEKLKPEDTATDLLSEAEALARRGELRAAIRKAYIALLVELGDRKLISLAQYKTNRDYVRAVSNLPQLHPRLKKLTESFERHWYGFAQATPNDWQDFRAAYREALHHGN